MLGYVLQLLTLSMDKLNNVYKHPSDKLNLIRLDNRQTHDLQYSFFVLLHMSMCINPSVELSYNHRYHK